MQYSILHSPIGSIAIIFNKEELKITRIILPPVIPAILKEHKKSNFPFELTKTIENILPEHLDFSRVSIFARNVLLTLARLVPSGKVVTYSELAKLACHKNAARAVGNIMASNPFPLIIPCHRVVRSDRTPGFFQGGKKGMKLKKKLLELEGIKFDPKDRVLKKFII